MTLAASTYTRAQALRSTMISALVLLLTIPALLYFEDDIGVLSDELRRRGLIFLLVLSIAILNNVYQVVAHLLSMLRFLGNRRGFAPGGMRDDQTSAEFMLYNVIDILGWLTLFVVLGRVPLLPAFLVCMHVAAGVDSLANRSTFQAIYIGPAPRGAWWDHARGLFVGIDAVARGYLAVLALLSL